MKKLLVITGLLLAASAASAGTVNMTFVAFHGAGWWVGYPYYATIDNGATIAVMCDDWAHGGQPGQMWQANVTDLGTGNLADLRFNQLPNALTLYDEAGWLLLQTEVVPSSQWTDMNYAVWHIFDSSAPLSHNARNWLTLAQNEALAGFPGVNFHQVQVLTPVNQHDPNVNDAQEFLTIVPEPTTLALLAGGLLGIWGRKRIRYTLAKNS